MSNLGETAVDPAIASICAAAEAVKADETPRRVTAADVHALACVCTECSAAQETVVQR